jgi:pimeloyl-ACP methyl ester carboxylesterase
MTGRGKKHYDKCRSIKLSCGDIVYAEEGEGQPLILIHGIPLCSLTWRNNIPGLSGHYHVYAVDLKGFGMSVKGGGGFSLNEHADVIKEFVEEKEIGAVNIAGHSFGCGVAITFAVKYPETAKRLILINPVCYSGGRHSTERMARIGIINNLASMALKNKMLGYKIFSSKYRKSYSNLSVTDKELEITYYDLLRNNGGVDTFLKTLQEYDEVELEKRLKEIKQESLIIWGSKDEVLPLTNLDRLRKDIKNNRVHILDDCGHMPHEESYEKVNRFIIDFVG